MKSYPPRRPAHHPRVPPFSPVPLRTRSDGWTPQRQAAFLAALAITQSVREAARRVGMARETVYRLRGKPGAESFAATWDFVLKNGDGKWKVTSQERARRALSGLLKPVIYNARHIATVTKPDNSALLALLKKAERAMRPGRAGRGRSQGFARRFLPPERDGGEADPREVPFRSLLSQLISFP